MRETLRDKALLSYLTDSHWAMHEPVLARLVDIVARHSDGVRLEPKAIEAAIGRSVAASGADPQPPRLYRLHGSTAIIPVYGVIAKYANQVNDVSQPVGTSVEQISADLARALEDRKVNAIVLDIESPGGSVSGIFDLADRIYEARAIKPVHAHSQDLAASAAFLLASQAQSFTVGRGADIGSIGVYTVLRDASRAAEQSGVRYHLVRSGPYKGTGSYGVSISEEELSHIQDRINAKAMMFVQDVARGRGLAAEHVAAMATGAVWTGIEAVEAGLADATGTLEALLEAVETKPAGPVVPARRSTSTVAAGDMENDMSGKTEKPATDQAADVEAIRAEAARAANEAAAQRVKELSGVLGGRTELLSKALAEGWDATAAKAHLADELAVENKALGEQLEAANAKAQEVAKELQEVKALAAKAGVKPVDVKGDSEPADDATAYEKAVEARAAELVASGKSANAARGQATREVAKAMPQLHQAYVKAQQGK